MTPTLESDSHPEKDSFLGLFQEVTRLITSTLKVDSVLDVIAKKIPDVLGVDAATIRLLDPAGTKLILHAAHGLSREYLDRGPVDAEKSVMKALAGSPVAIYDAASDRRINYSNAAQKEGVKSILVAPIPIRGKISGVLRLLTRDHRHFKEQEIEFVTALAEQCGIAIENARVHEDQQQQIQFFKTLHNISKALNSALQLQEVLDLMVTRLPEVMDLKGCTIRLLEPGKVQLDLMAASGLSQEYLGRGSIDDELSTHHTLKGEPVVIFDATTDSRIRYQKEAAREGVASILAVPIVVKKKTIGVLRLLTARPRNFTDAEINFAMAVAEQSGIAIQNAIGYNKISKLVKEMGHQEEFLQHIMDGLNADLFVLDADLRIVMVNRTFLKNFKVDENAIIGRPYDRIITIMEPEDKLFKTAGLDHRTVAATRHIDAGEGQKHLEILVTPVSVFDSNSKIDFFIGTIRDITAHSLLQEEQRTRERLQGVLEMAGAAVHELNTPVFAALGTAQLLLADPDKTESQYDDLQTIIRNLKIVSELTRKMSRITRYKAKTYAGQTKIVDITKSGDEAH
jgi:PAS domain S-box-containing protein